MSIWEGIASIIYIIVLVFFVSFAIFALAAFLIVPLTNTQETTITVVEKIPYHDEQYLIISEVGDKEEVLRVGDVWLLGIFDASDRYAYLKTNMTYNVTLSGYRVPILSWYRNINVIEGR